MTTNMNSTRINTFRKNAVTASRQYNGRVNSPIMTHQKNRKKKHCRRYHSRNKLPGNLFLRKSLFRNGFLIIAGILLYLTVLAPSMQHFFSASDPFREQPDSGARTFTGELSSPEKSSFPEELPEEMVHLLELNAEAADYVNGYPDRDVYRTCDIDLTEDFISGQVPLLMQWDTRWGYNDYGDSFIGLAGCGPVCLEMAYLYFTEDTSFTPRDMADFAYRNGYYTSEGTSWSLWTEGAEQLGLMGSELSLDDSLMYRALDAGHLIVCSMRPGDFTTTGHFILIRGYDENGFYVNDPNRRSNGEKQWDFATLQYQIRNLWELSP